MREALVELNAGRIREGVDLVQAAACGLVADAADVPEVGLTPKDACLTLEDLAADGDLVVRVGKLLETCDAARYGVFDRNPATFRQEAEGLLEEVIGQLKAKKRFR
jgi:hypothetical protein